jgi:hypothetical protein
VLAALLALAFGYAVGEEWIMDSLGMQACDTAVLRAGVEEVMTNMLALGQGPTGSCD